MDVVTPPNAVGYANGIAQSIVSLARCVGPVIGGYVSALLFVLLCIVLYILSFSYGPPACRTTRPGTI